MGHGASSARRKAPAAPAAPANPREKRPSKIAGRPDHEAADGPPLTHAEAARLARSRTSAMLERILDDRRECEILEAFLHSEYRVELLYSVWKSNLQPDFNVRVIERFGPDYFAVLRELDESNRFVPKSAKSTSI